MNINFENTRENYTHSSLNKGISLIALIVTIIEKLNLYAQWKNSYVLNIDTNNTVATVTKDSEYTYFNVAYQNKNSTDKTYYKIGSNGAWIEYSNIIKFDMSCIQNTTDTLGHKGTSTIYFKKVDQNGNEDISNKECKIDSTVYEVYQSLKNKGKTYTEYFTESFSIGNQGPGHSFIADMTDKAIYLRGAGYGTRTAIFTLDFSKLDITKADDISAILNHWANISSDSMNSYITIEYKDGTKSETKTSTKISDERWLLSYGGTQTKQSVSIDIDKNKTINKIEIKFVGYDSDNGGIAGAIREVKFNNAIK